MPALGRGQGDCGAGRLGGGELSNLPQTRDWARRLDELDIIDASVDV